MPRKKRPAPPDDPLGKLLSDYHVSLAGVLIVSGVIALLGLGGLGYGLTRKPVSLIAAGLGGLALLMAVALLVMNVFNVGRRLEVRKRGLRYTEAGVVTEFRWDEVAAVDVDRTGTSCPTDGQHQPRGGVRPPPEFGCGRPVRAADEHGLGRDHPRHRRPVGPPAAGVLEDGWRPEGGDRPDPDAVRGRVTGRRAAWSTGGGFRRPEAPP